MPPQFFYNALLIIFFLSFSLPAAAIWQNEGREDPFQVARTHALLAGGAFYCKANIDDYEEYIGLSEGKIAALARDRYEMLLARLEFKNLLTAQKAKEPEEGCPALLSRFEKERRAVE